MTTSSPALLPTGAEVDMTALFDWSAAEPDIAYPDAGGVVRGCEAGTTEVPGPLEIGVPIQRATVSVVGAP